MKNSIRWARFSRAGLLLPAWLLALPIVARAQFTFTLNNDGSLNIYQYTGSGGVVVIPSATNGYPITSIGDYAFVGSSSLTSVIITNSVISIGKFAFQLCSGLTNVTIGNSVTSISDNAFGGCTSMTSIIVDTNNPSYISVAGVLFNERQTALIAYPEGLTGSDYSIPNTVASIGDYAFNGNTNLTSVTIPNSVTSIGDSAFSVCINLTSLMIPNGVTSIGNYAFYDCTRLISVTIGNNVTSIGADAFNGCTKLTSVTIPNSVTTIGDWAFSSCASLTNVMIGNSVTSIGYYAFGDCTSLTAAYLSGNMPSGDNTEFLGGESGTAYYLPGTTGWSSYFGSWPTALWYQPNPMILGSGYGLGVTANGFNFTISWATNAPVVVEACTNLANPVWLPLATNTLTSGTNYFSDTQWTNYPVRFYRLRSP
jgi:hypothetical protein